MMRQILLVCALVMSAVSLMISIETNTTVIKQAAKLMPLGDTGKTEVLEAVTNELNHALVTFRGHWMSEEELIRTNIAIREVLSGLNTEYLLEGREPGKRMVGPTMRTVLAAEARRNGAKGLDTIFEIKLQAGP